MSAGRLKRRVTLKNVVRVSDGAGGWDRADATETTVWAEVREAKPMEVQRAMTVSSRIDRIVRIRWRADLAASFGPEAVAVYTDNAGRVHTLAVKTLVDSDDASRWIFLGCLEGGPV